MKEISKKKYPKSARWRAFKQALNSLWDAGDIYDVETGLYNAGLTNEVFRYDAHGNIYKINWASSESEDYAALKARLRNEIAAGDKKKGRLIMAPSEELAYYEEIEALVEEFKSELALWRKRYETREARDWEKWQKKDRCPYSEA